MELTVLGEEVIIAGLHLPLVVPTDSSVAAFPAYWAIQDPGRKVVPSTRKHGCL